jgi:heme oxygenase
MYRPSPTLTRLNLETRRYHANANESWLALLDAKVDRARYRDQLVRVYGFEGPVEAATAYTPGRVDVGELRPRSGYIVEDLISLGMRPAEIARLPQCLVAPFASQDEALGWIYVVERAAQLHESVFVHLEAKVLGSAKAAVYLQTTAGRVASRWRCVNTALSAFDDDRRAQNRIIDAAHAAFRTAIAWYSIDVARAA